MGHAGLHRRQALLWSDRQADPARCPGSGRPGERAAQLADGFPGGRALCPDCHRFVDLNPDGRLVEHDTDDPRASDLEVLRSREWFNTHGW